jgi:hypothetical protein
MNNQFFDITKLPINKEETKYYICVDTYDENANAYCLSKMYDKNFDIVLCKTIHDKSEFEMEVENLTKYFNAIPLKKATSTNVVTPDILYKRLKDGGIQLNDKDSDRILMDMLAQYKWQ